MWHSLYVENKRNNEICTFIGRSVIFCDTDNNAVVRYKRRIFMTPFVRFWQVGWVKADTKAIQAIHEHVITHNHRVSVSHSDHFTWYLHVKNVQEEDRGQYMCQINTDPMKSQVSINIRPKITDIYVHKCTRQM